MYHEFKLTFLTEYVAMISRQHIRVAKPISTEKG